MNRLFFTLVLLCAGTSIANAQPATDPAQQFANLGECTLASGKVINDCRIGYLTLGTLNRERSNAILFPTWYGGTSRNILQYLGPGKLVDTDKFFVIVVDSFGNGVSSSPSNSSKQSGAAFPAVSIRDMVHLQKRLLNEHLKLSSLHAVVGISMGAMQTLEWAVWQPGIASRFVAIAGSPRLAPYDLVLWHTDSRLIRMMIDCNCQTPMQVLAGTRFLSNVVDNQNAPYPSKDKILGSIAEQKMDPAIGYDRLLQLGAMIGHDVTRGFDNDLANAAKQVGNKLLVLVGSKDRVVTPSPALEFAKLAGGKALEFPTCGHDIPRCSADLINPAVRDFLER